MLRGKGQPQLAQVDIHVVTGALKLFLKTLKEPLITWTLWSCFTNVADMEEEVDVQNQIYSIFPDLPQPNRDTLAYLILHLQRYLYSYFKKETRFFFYFCVFFLYYL